tara:strand:- start:89 stop:589 length:501 start_codon:yes stop_codon:yes gene_type:complete
MNIKDISFGGPVSLRSDISLAVKLYLHQRGFVPIGRGGQIDDCETFLSTTSDDTLTIKILTDPLTRASIFAEGAWDEWHGMYATKMEYKGFIYFVLVSPQDLSEAVGAPQAKEALRRALRGVCVDENETLRNQLVRDRYILLLHNTSDKVGYSATKNEALLKAQSS